MTTDPDQSDEVPSDPVSVARSICLSQLTRAPRTRSQLADTLRRRLVPDAAAEQVLDRLTEVGLIDDDAYARAWVDSRRSSRGLSARALARELHDRGIPAEVVDAALADVSGEDDEATARELARRRLRSYADEVPSEVKMRRTVAMLGRKGYAPGLAYRVVRAEVSAADP